MLICKECFVDIELRAYVDSNSVKSGVCEICHERGKLIDLSDLYPFFLDILELFDFDETGSTISDIIQNDWEIFKNKKISDDILSEVMKFSNCKFDITSKVNYTTEILERVSIWEKLKKNVKEKYRFFTSIDEFAQYKYLIPAHTLFTGRKLYRSRITPAGINKLKREQMGCPPKELASAGRANPIGIPYLYLSASVKTTYFEVRALYLDKISVGTFVIQRDLKLVDFVYDVNLFAASQEDGKSLKEVVIKKKVIDSISADLSKPLRRYDSELEYVPTQLICEYCRGLSDGICFKSSLHKGGRNYVLFDPESAKCVRVVSHEIKKIDIDRK